MRLIFLILVGINIALASLLIIKKDNMNASERPSTWKNFSSPSDKPTVKVEIEQKEFLGSCWLWSVFLIGDNREYNLEYEDDRINQILKTDVLQSRWWVYIPPQRSLASMNEKAELLQLSGIDVFPQTGPGKMRWSISLGRFSSEDGARDFVGRVKKLGVSSIVLNKSPKKLKRIYVVLPINDPNKAILETLNTIHPSYEWQETECVEP